MCHTPISLRLFHRQHWRWHLTWNVIGSLQTFAQCIAIVAILSCSLCTPCSEYLLDFLRLWSVASVYGEGPLSARTALHGVRRSPLLRAFGLLCRWRSVIGIAPADSVSGVLWIVEVLAWSGNDGMLCSNPSRRVAFVFVIRINKYSGRWCNLITDWLTSGSAVYLGDCLKSASRIHHDKVGCYSGSVWSSRLRPHCTLLFPMQRRSSTFRVQTGYDQVVH